MARAVGVVAACSTPAQHGGRSDPASQLPQPEGRGTAGGGWHRFRREARGPVGAAAAVPAGPGHAHLGTVAAPRPQPFSSTTAGPSQQQVGPGGSTCRPDLAGAGAGQGGGAPCEEVASRDRPRHLYRKMGACGWAGGHREGAS